MTESMTGATAASVRGPVASPGAMRPLRGYVPPPLNLTATTTSAAQTVTLYRVTPTGGDVVVSWGDGSETTVVDGYGGSIAHEYASAGSYQIEVSDSPLITYLYINDDKLTCSAGEIGSLTNLAYLWLVGSLVTMGAGETAMLANLQELVLLSTPNVTVAEGEIVSLASTLTYLRLGDVAGVTMGATEVSALASLAYLNLATSPGVAFQTGLDNCPALATLVYRAGLSQGQVDGVLSELYAAFPSRTATGGLIYLDSGGNAAPSGILQSACPPTTGKEYAYELANDSCDAADNPWAAVVVQA